MASSSTLGRLLGRVKGNSDEGAAFAHAAEPTLVSATSSEDGIAGEPKGGARSTAQDRNELLDHYEPIEKYEGKHRYDPRAQWTEQEEKRLVRKIDYKICAWVCFMFFALQLDRSNITQALSDNMLGDLHMTTNNYNYGMTIFYISFLLAELPSQGIGKKIGPDNWVPIQMVLWSIVACSQSRITGKSTFYLTRSLLGLCEGGFIPDCVLYLSYFYKSKELPIRLSFFWGAYIVTSIVGAFLAFGILHLSGRCGMAGWQWLFALEGALTALIGIIS
ncbi:hypothetical protein MMC20_004203 [Loxospora ochrophaea]|nr:hypothetical protein [Loxospora ochrophaea]